MGGTATSSSASKRDAAIIGTNDSSIVSKRSVERLYSAPTSITNGYEYLRFVVKRPKRRSPLINRGYWIRMKAIRTVLSKFISKKAPHGGTKVVVNLGCGYDTLPFEYISHWKQTISSSSGTTSVYFVDVDYPDCIQKKCELIKEAPELLHCLSDVDFNTSKHVKLQSKEYMAISADLHNISELNDVLVGNFQKNSEFLFISEVSIIYMCTSAADELIRWAASFPNSSFCLLEQILPGGPNHPFAQTMIRHFGRIGTPLNLGYHTIQSQIERFESRCWPNVVACDLFSFWCDLPADEKERVESAELFDEHEELVLFMQHYVLLQACHTPHSHSVPPRKHPATEKYEQTVLETKIWPTTFQGTNILRRRYGAACKISHDSIIYHGGSDGKRLDSLVTMSRQETRLAIDRIDTGAYPQNRLCHTLTDLGDGSLLLIGGRASPGSALSDCWMLRNGKWLRVQDLPGGGRYRHCAARLGSRRPRILVFGGVTKSSVSTSTWLIWSECDGWRDVKLDTGSDNPDVPCARWNASIASFEQSSNGMTEGVMSGGMVSDRILGDIWKWSIMEDDTQLNLKKLELPAAYSSSISRFGAQMLTSSSNEVILVGGVCRDALRSSEEHILQINLDTSSVSTFKIQSQGDGAVSPLLVGSSSCKQIDGSLTIFGGGAVCFSFGSYWNSGIWTLAPKTELIQDDYTFLTWDIREIVQVRVATSVPHSNNNQELKDSHQGNNGSHRAGDILRIKSPSTKEFADIYKRNRPVVLEGVDFGACQKLWSYEYLRQRLDPEKKIVVHEGKEQNMNFQTKNFSYVTMPVGDFLDTVFSNSRRMYFRALSAMNPTAAPASIKDFPEICDDFKIPSELSFIAENEFSSPLRISSAEIGMWLHYDVMSNCLFHCHGRKRLILFPPRDIQPYLQFPPGQTTSAIENIFENIPDGTQPLFTIMEPGDVLFIPRFWPHAALPLTPCVAINVFFKSSDVANNAYSNDGKDLYGNKDLKAYESGVKAVRKILANFDGASGIPDDIRSLYLKRLAAELIAAADILDSSEKH